MRDHALRQVLHDEVHARPHESLTAPLEVTHLAHLSGEGAAPSERAHLALLCGRHGVAAVPDSSSFLSLDLGSFRLRWERHTEFSTYTFYRRGGRQPFAESAIVPASWLAEIPGERLIAIRLALAPADAVGGASDTLAAYFPSDVLAGSVIDNGKAAAWTDFRIGPDGFERILVRDGGATPRQAGRVVQRLCEIETYRIMALLALPVARETAQQLVPIEAALSEITTAIGAARTLEAESELLARLTGLAAEIERLSAAGNYRFSAAKAYYALVERRIAELHESRSEAMQTLAEFMDRRLAPAMRTCLSVGERLESLSVRISRAAQLLRARVEVALEGQNRDLLESMNRRAWLQLRLQQTVEGLSIAAISYYVVGLIGYAAKAAKSSGVSWDPDIVQGLSIPFVLAAVFLGARHIRRMIRRDSGKISATGGKPARQGEYRAQ